MSDQGAGADRTSGQPEVPAQAGMASATHPTHRDLAWTDSDRGASTPLVGAVD